MKNINFVSMYESQIDICFKRYALFFQPLSWFPPNPPTTTAASYKWMVLRFALSLSYFILHTSYFIKGVPKGQLNSIAAKAHIQFQNVTFLSIISFHKPPEMVCWLVHLAPKLQDNLGRSVREEIFGREGRKGWIIRGG